MNVKTWIPKKMLFAISFITKNIVPRNQKYDSYENVEQLISFEEIKLLRNEPHVNNGKCD